MNLVITGSGDSLSLNPLCAKFFVEDIKVYLQFKSFLYTHMTQVAEILPYVRQEFTFST